MEENETGLEKSEVEEFLDETYGTNIKILPLTPRKLQKTKKSKIDLAGRDVATHLMKLAIETDLSYAKMARRINDRYELGLTKSNVVTFFKTNLEAIELLAKEQKSLNEFRSKIFLEHHTVLIKDIKLLDEEIKNVLKDDMLESDKRAKEIANLVDKKGRLLLRHARLSGNLKDEKKPPQQTNTQINIFQGIDSKKAEIINRLKKAEFREVEFREIPAKE